MASLPHDASGFLIGERLVNGIDLVGKDTTEILKILKSSIGLQQESNNRLRVTLDRINNQSQRRVIDVTPTPLPVHRIGNNSQQLPTVDIGAPTSDVQPIPPTIEHGHDSGRVDDARLSDIDNPIPTPNENTNGSPTLPIQDIEPALPPAPLDDGRRNAQPSDDPDSNNNRHGNGLRRNARGQGDNAPPVDITPPDDGRRGNGRRRNARGQFEGDNAPPVDITPPDDGRRGNGRRRNARGQFEGDNAPPVDITPPDDGRRGNGRRRNSRGQFEGEGSGGLINGIKNAVRDGFSMGSADTQNIDPTVDAVRELSDLMSPLAKVGKTMFKGAAWLFRRKKKREEPSDQEQRQQSRIEKLLKRIAGSRVGQAAGSGFNLFGGLFSSLTGTVGGALGFIPALISSIFSPIASVFRVVPSLIMGAIAPIGRVLTSLAPMLMRFLPIALGVTAAFKLGEWVGGKIYDAIGPKLGEAVDWTVDAVKAIPEKIGKAWDTFTGGLSDYFKEKWHNVTEKTKEIVSNTQDKVGSVGDFAAYQMDKMLATVGATKAIREAAQERLNQRDRGEIGFTPQNYKAKTTNNTSLGQVAADTGEALTTQTSSHKYAPLLDEIAKGESKSGAFGTSGYDAIYGGAKVKPSKPISQMTVGEVKAYQQQLIKAGSGSSAVGRYQFIKNDDAFANMTAEAGLKDADIFDSATQDRLATHYMGGEKKIDELLKTGNDAALTNITARQWASMKNASGRGNYDGDKIGNFARHGGITAIQKARQQILANETQPQPTVNAMAQAPLNAVNGGMTSTVSAKTFAPAIPTTVPKLLARPLPETPKVKQQVSTKEQPPMKVSVVDGGSTIGQNLSDRHLAHAVTGGLGMDALRTG